MGTVRVANYADPARRGFILGLPTESVIVTPMAKVEKAAHRSQKIARRLYLMLCRGRQQSVARPAPRLVHGCDQRQPVGDVEITHPSRPVFYVGFKMKDRAAKFGVTVTRDFNQTLHQSRSLTHDQVGHQLAIEFVEKYA